MWDEEQSSFVFEEAFSGAALLNCDREEIGGDIGHQDLFHVAQRRSPRHLVQVLIEPCRRRPVQKVGLFHLQVSGVI